MTTPAPAPCETFIQKKIAYSRRPEPLLADGAHVRVAPDVNGLAQAAGQLIGEPGPGT